MIYILFGGLQAISENLYSHIHQITPNEVIWCDWIRELFIVIGFLTINITLNWFSFQILIIFSYILMVIVSACFSFHTEMLAIYVALAFSGIASSWIMTGTVYVVITQTRKRLWHICGYCTWVMLGYFLTYNATYEAEEIWIKFHTVTSILFFLSLLPIPCILIVKMLHFLSHDTGSSTSGWFYSTTVS
jgi:hypothetical protein